MTAGAQNSGDCDLVIVLNGDFDESLTVVLLCNNLFYNHVTFEMKKCARSLIFL